MSDERLVFAMIVVMITSFAYFVWETWRRR